MSVCVIGAGIIGLSTALKIQELEPRAKVTIVAEDISPDTTSNIAAGFWRPIFIEDPRSELIGWGKETFELCKRLWNEDPKRYGCIKSTGYELFNERSTEVPEWSSTMHDFHQMSSADLKSHNWESDFVDGIFYTTYLLEGNVYLPILIERFKQNGGSIVRKKLSTPNQAIEYGSSVVVNCSGLGSYHLFGDKSCYPIRGQVIRVRAPLIRHHYAFGDDFYVLPNTSSVVLGGTHQIGDWNTQEDPADTKKILNGIRKYLPSIKAVDILKVQVGLRPGRPQIRLEREDGRLKVPVVHNYGHGGSGVTLHQGCANDAADLAVKAIHDFKSSI